MHNIEVDIPFSAGHRLLGYDGPCSHYHGHNYIATVVIEGSMLNSLDMVADFSDIKKVIKHWIDRNWDHNMILHPDDLMFSSEAYEFLKLRKRPFAMPNKLNPTAEAMGLVLYDTVQSLLIFDESYSRRGLTCPMVSIQETPNCSATYMGDVR